MVNIVWSFGKGSIALAVFGMLLAGSVSAASNAKEKVLHTFAGNDGSEPLAGLTADATGHFYGTTEHGGTTGSGTAFELKHTRTGWKESVLHSFSGGDGAYPYAALTFDLKGNLYGTTFYGGAYFNGSVFKLTHSKAGWKETVLFSFTGGSDGSNPWAGVVVDKAGRVYGTTSQSDNGNGYGTVYQLTHSKAGWTQTTIHSFTGAGDGAFPVGCLIFDSNGNLYGTTADGGAYNHGTVFELRRSGNSWTEALLYSFMGGTDGASPQASVVFDAVGALYGTTYIGGSSGCAGSGCGTIFELVPSEGTWTESVLYSFAGGNDASQPTASVVFDQTGNLYSATGGGAHGYGAVFELSPNSGGGWTEKVLYSFAGGKDGGYPSGGVITDKSSRLYGTTWAGGNGANGVIYRVTP